MVIAVITVGVMQTSIYQIVVVIAVWNEWMSASIMSALTCNGGADIGVIGADCNHMLIIVPLVRVVQMSVMQIIHVPVVKNANVPTMLAVDMRMGFVNRMRHRSDSFPPGRLIRRACVCHLQYTERYARVNQGWATSVDLESGVQGRGTEERGNNGA
jgi:hypothetical protein